MITIESVGCIVSSDEGYYMAKRIIEFAQDHGFSLCDDDAVRLRFMYDSECDRATRDDCTNHVLSTGGILDDAVAHLNREVAPGGTYFDVYEGDFMLQTTEWWGCNGEEGE
jgi:hypothetical protein